MTDGKDRFIFRPKKEKTQNPFHTFYRDVRPCVDFDLRFQACRHSDSAS
jgi:hypothetical protein